MGPRHVKMNMTCNATFEIKLVGGPTIGFNGGPADLKPSQWLDLERRLEAMTPDEACAYMDHTGWTRYHAEEPAASTGDHQVHGRVEAALRFLTERLGNGSIDQEGRDIVTGILGGTLDENGNVRPA